MVSSNAIPRYIDTITGDAVVTTGTANTSRVHPPTASSVVDGPVAGTHGALVTHVDAVATVTTTAGLFQVWHKDAGGNYTLISETVTSAVTPSTTVAGATVSWTPPDGGEMKLAAGCRLAFTVSKAEVWAVVIEQADY